MVHDDKKDIMIFTDDNLTNKRGQGKKSVS